MFLWFQSNPQLGAITPHLPTPQLYKQLIYILLHVRLDGIISHKWSQTTVCACRSGIFHLGMFPGCIPS